MSAAYFCYDVHERSNPINLFTCPPSPHSPAPRHTTVQPSTQVLDQQVGTQVKARLRLRGGGCPMVAPQYPEIPGYLLFRRLLCGHVWGWRRNCQGSAHAWDGWGIGLALIIGLSVLPYLKTSGTLQASLHELTPRQGRGWKYEEQSDCCLWTFSTSIRL